MTSTPLTTATAAPADAPRTARTLQTPVAVDAVASAVFGAVLVLGAPSVAELTGMGVGWLRGIGVFALVYAADLTYLAFRLRATTGPKPTRMASGSRLVRMVGIGNLGWVAASAAVAVAVDLTGAGVAIVTAQALLVLGIAVWQLVAGRSTVAGR